MKDFWTKIIELDEAAEREGGYVIPLQEEDPRYDLAGMRKYAKSCNISVSELSEEEIEKFIVVAKNRL